MCPLGNRWWWHRWGNWCPALSDRKRKFSLTSNVFFKQQWRHNQNSCRHQPRLRSFFLEGSLLRQYECKIAILEGLSGRTFCHPVSDCRGFLFVTENEGKIKKSTKTKVKTVNVNPHKIQSITNPNIKSSQCYQTGLFQSESPRYRESPKYRSWLPVHHCHFWQMREIESEVDSLSWCSNFSNDQMIRFLCW